MSDPNNRQNKRKITIRVTAQTLYHLRQLAEACGYKDLGRVVDKLTREKMLELKEWRNTGEKI